MSRLHEGLRARADSRRVIAEANALVTGQMIEGMPRTAREWGVPGVPSWMFVNKLAHAGEAELRALAQRRTRPGGTAWDGAVNFLAGELLAADRRPGGAVRIQRDALVPYELDVLQGLVPEPASAREMVCAVRARIAAARVRRGAPRRAR